MEGGGPPRLVPFVVGTSQLGIDVGGVLAQSDTDVAGRGGGGRGLTVDMQYRPPTADCIAIVSALVRLFGPERTFIVSKCGEHMQRATVVWLRHFDFFAKTGVLTSHVAFCANRSGIEGEGLELSWRPLAAPDQNRLDELCAATGRAAEEVRGWFCDDMAQVASAAVPLEDMQTSNCGKGVVARDLRLTHFIDDRTECLHSVFFEGFLAVPIEDGGLCGLANAAAHGAMVHFGPSVSSKAIAKAPSRDPDLLKLMPDGSMSTKKQMQPQGPAESAEEVWNLMGSAPHEGEGLHEKWGELLLLRQSAPTPPAKGQKPDEATIAVMKAHKVKESEFLGKLSKEGRALLKRYEKALTRSSPKASQAALSSPSQGREKIQRTKVPQRARWINESAPHFWRQRRACDYLATGWNDVARLFGLAVSISPDVDTSISEVEQADA